jgi:protein phosphatase
MNHEKPPLRLVIASRTDIGNLRSSNQDMSLVGSLRATERHLGDYTGDVVIAPGEGGAVLAVCDGMGGAAGGEVASLKAVEAIFESMSTWDPTADPRELGQRLVGSIQHAAREVFGIARTTRSLAGMGTTATVAALVDDRLLVGQVGDSRAYLLRDGTLVQLTRDQSLAVLLMERGQLTAAEAEKFEHGHVILQAVGTTEDVDVDLRWIELADGDVLMLCSDGLTGPVGHVRIREVLASLTDPGAACAALVRAALEGGGPDNITCIVARIEGASRARTLPIHTQQGVPDPDPEPPPPPPPAPVAPVAPVANLDAKPGFLRSIVARCERFICSGTARPSSAPTTPSAETSTRRSAP